MFVFFTEILKCDIVDRQGRWVGRPYDFMAKLDEPYPPLTSLVAIRPGISRRFYVISWANLHHVAGHFELKQPLESLTPVKRYHELGVATLRQNILDQQVVDTLNRKLVRVNDLHFLAINGDLRLAHVDVGVRGLVRRLGWERWIDRVVRLVSSHASYLSQTQFIAWKYIQPLSIHDASGRIQLSVGQEELRHIPPADISEMLTELDPFHRGALLKTLDVERQVDIISELDLKWQKALMEDLDVRAAAQLIERMPADKATDLFQSMGRRDSHRIMELISTRKARELQELMLHHSDSAGGIMTKEFVVFTSQMTVGEAIEHVRAKGIKAETFHTCYVIDEEQKLVGMVRMRSLLLESNDTPLAKVMLRKPPALRVTSPFRDVAYAFEKYHSFVMPVVDGKRILQGIVTMDDVLSRVIHETWGEKTAL